jgi:UDP-glucose-4-epimerase GalE
MIRALVRACRPVAALHFAAFIEVAESVANPARYFGNNRDKAALFFDALAAEGVKKIVFSSTAAVYGDGGGILTEDHPTRPVNPYGQSKLEAETRLRAMDGVASVCLRYFNVAGAAPEAGLGEAHFPESHLIPRIVLPLIGLPVELENALDLSAQGFRIYGDDYPTPDGTAVRDYVHVLDLAEAHVLALRYLLDGGGSALFNLGSGGGYSVKEIVRAARDVMDWPDCNPVIAPRRAGDAAMLVANSDKARTKLGWRPRHGVAEMIASAATWHRSKTYVETMLARARG